LSRLVRAFRAWKFLLDAQRGGFERRLPRADARPAIWEHAVDGEVHSEQIVSAVPLHEAPGIFPPLALSVHQDAQSLAGVALKGQVSDAACRDRLVWPPAQGGELLGVPRHDLCSACCDLGPSLGVGIWAESVESAPGALVVTGLTFWLLTLGRVPEPELRAAQQIGACDGMTKAAHRPMLNSQDSSRDRHVRWSWVVCRWPWQARARCWWRRRQRDQRIRCLAPGPREMVRPESR
jgi:hypothetical protein